MSTDFFDPIYEGIKKAEAAFTGLSSVADELAAIQEGMPEFIRKHIPVAIWDALETFTETIDRQILPRLINAERVLETARKILISYGVKFGDLADKLAHPGTNLLTIDDLPDYAKNQELWAVDDIASRLFGESADQERLAMSADLAKFDLIDAAATAPLPEPSFMTIESPARAALHGIVATPKETWFIDGYNDQH